MKFSQILLLAFSVVSAHGIGVDLPKYMQRCSLKDPNLNDCMRKNGNAAIPELVKGESTLDIPVLSPLLIPEVKLSHENFRMVLTDVLFDNFKDFVLDNMNFDLQNQKADFSIRAPYLNFSSHYTISDSKILSRSISGSGRSQMSLVDNAVEYRVKLGRLSKDGDEYLHIDDSECKLTSNLAFFYFENIFSTTEEAGDTDLFLQQHWEVVRDNIKPGIEKFVCTYINMVMDKVSIKVPVKKLFLVD